MRVDRRAAGYRCGSSAQGECTSQPSSGRTANTAPPPKPAPSGRHAPGRRGRCRSRSPRRWSRRIRRSRSRWRGPWRRARPRRWRVRPAAARWAAHRWGGSAPRKGECVLPRSLPPARGAPAGSPLAAIRGESAPASLCCSLRHGVLLDGRFREMVRGGCAPSSGVLVLPTLCRMARVEDCSAPPEGAPPRSRGRDVIRLGRGSPSRIGPATAQTMADAVAPAPAGVDVQPMEHT